MIVFDSNAGMATIDLLASRMSQGGRCLRDKVVGLVTPGWERLDISVVPATSTIRMMPGPATCIFDRVGVEPPSSPAAEVPDAAALILPVKNFIRALGLLVTSVERQERTVLTWASEFMIQELADLMFLAPVALGDLSWLSTTFPHGLPGAEPWLIAALVAAILDQTPVSEASLPVVDVLVGALARPSGPLGATYEWGTALPWAFRDRLQEGVVRPVPLPETLTRLQERLLAALVDNDKVWNLKSGNDSLAFARVGLPHDRSAVASLVPMVPPKFRPSVVASSLIAGLSCRPTRRSSPLAADVVP